MNVKPVRISREPIYIQTLQELPRILLLLLLLRDHGLVYKICAAGMYSACCVYVQPTKQFVPLPRIVGYNIFAFDPTTTTALLLDH